MTDIVERLLLAPLAYHEWNRGSGSADQPVVGATAPTNSDTESVKTQRLSAANRVASSTLGQGESGAYPAAESAARAKVVATPGTPGGGAVADRIQDVP